MRGLAFTPAQQRLTMAVAGVSLIPADFTSESIDPPRIAASLAGRRSSAMVRRGSYVASVDARRHPVLLVELLGDPRRIRELLVQRLPVADAAAQQLGPGGDRWLSDREIVMTRVFDAPRNLVFDAYTPSSSPRWRAELHRATTSSPSCWHRARWKRHGDERNAPSHAPQHRHSPDARARSEDAVALASGRGLAGRVLLRIPRRGDTPPHHPGRPPRRSDRSHRSLAGARLPLLQGPRRRWRSVHLAPRPRVAP